MRSALVVEAGGTSLRAARYDLETGELRLRRYAGTPNFLAAGRGEDRHHDLVADILAAVASLAERAGPAAGIGVAYPGPVTGDGRVLAAPTVTGTARAELALRERLAQVWPDTPVVVVNDVTAAGLRYVRDGRRDFAIVTVGSGIGHKVFLGGRPVVGPNGRGGEIGHLRVDPATTAAICDCGATGHLGGLASGRGVAESVRRALVSAGRRGDMAGVAQPEPGPVTGATVAAAFLRGDGVAVAAVSQAAALLGQALAGLHLGTGVEEFILVGGFALHAGERYRHLVAEAAAAASWDLGLDWDSAVVLGDPAGTDGLVGTGIAVAEAVTGTALGPGRTAREQRWVPAVPTG